MTQHTLSRTPLVSPAFLISLSLGLFVLILYYPVIHFNFVNVDDFAYVVANAHVHQGLNLDGIKWAFTTFDVSNWHPITWLSYMLDFQLFGLNAGCFHFINLLFHLADTLLLFGLLYKFTRKLWSATAVAVLFAVHPLHVESVVWIAERKDVVSTFFFLSTIFAYSNYLKSNKKIGWYIFALVLFMLGLMAKPMVVTLPFVLLLFDYWPLERFQFINHEKLSKKDLLFLVSEKLPFFLLSGVSCIITVMAQRGAIIPEEQFLLSHRFANAVISYGSYLGKMFYPVHLALPYLLPVSISWTHFGLALLLLLAVSGFCIFKSVEKPYLLVGWLWFLGTLVPVIGIVQVGAQARADRYTYIPLIGIFIMLSWMFSDLVVKWKKIKYPIIIGFGLLLILLSQATRNQMFFWKNSITLFQHTLKVTENNYIAELNLGQALLDKGNQKEAAECFTKAIRINPNYSLGYLNIGVIKESQHKYKEALQYYLKAISINPSYADAYYNIGNVYFRQGHYKEAQEKYLIVLKLQPDSFEAYNGLGAVFSRLGNYKKALLCFRMALVKSPGYAPAKQNLNLLMKLWRRKKPISEQ